jgi:molybdopterin-guanine dinucleotide biosynthesis protein A
MKIAAVTGIVLAGGRASRFGAPKLEATIGGETLLGLSIRALAAMSAEILVAGPSLVARPNLPPGLDGPPPMRRIADDRPFEGPLVALAGALREVTTPLALVVGGDMPRLVPDVLRAMLERLASDEAIDAVTLEAPSAESGESSGEPSRRRPLPLALRVATGSEAAVSAVRAGDRSLVRMLDRLRSVEIPAAEWLPLDPEAHTLADVDRPEDLAQLRNDLR